MTKTPPKPLFVAAMLMLMATTSHAQGIDALRSVAQKAITTNPELTARMNALRAASDAVDVARGAYLPRVDLDARVGLESDRINNVSGTLHHHGAALSLNQTIWDGLITKNDVKRAGHEKLSRSFELQDITEQIALEAVRAYYDVLRFRKLVGLAEDNYVQHKYVHTQILSRVRAGVGRGVDLEQAGARLALAESNLTTELANLHDVSVRYRRIVGEAPAAGMPLPAPLVSGLPATAQAATLAAIQNNPAISAAIENLRASRAVASAREGAFQPKVEARVRSGVGHNFDAVDGQKRDTTAQLVLNWNLYNGGADTARIKEQANLVNQAADLRDRACRDARQVAAIAFNDTKKLEEQIILLDRNTLAIEKARDAYRQQFDIGQRSLLDLLNSENELYTARRSYANAEYDLGIAYVRTHAAVNQLGVQLGLVRDNETPQAPSEMSGWAAGEDGPTRCLAVAIEMESIDLQALDRRASTPTTPAVPMPASAPAPTSATPRTR